MNLSKKTKRILFIAIVVVLFVGTVMAIIFTNGSKPFNPFKPSVSHPIKSSVTSSSLENYTPNTSIAMPAGINKNASIAIIGEHDSTVGTIKLTKVTRGAEADKIAKDYAAKSLFTYEDTSSTDMEYAVYDFTLTTPVKKEYNLTSWVCGLNGKQLTFNGNVYSLQPQTFSALEYDASCNDYSSYKVITAIPKKCTSYLIRFADADTFCTYIKPE